MKDIREVFREHQNEEQAAKMARYMRDQFPFYGLPSPLRKELEKPYIKEAKGYFSWEKMDAIYADEHRECQYFVIDVLKSMKKKLTYEEIEHIKALILDRSWGDVNDELAKVIGTIGLKDERVSHLMLEWSCNENLWLRRVSILHQLSFKEKTNTNLLESILCANVGSKEFFINKALGWALRDYSKTDPQFVREILKRYELAPLTVKEASKYLR